MYPQRRSMSSRVTPDAVSWAQLCAHALNLCRPLPTEVCALSPKAAVITSPRRILMRGFYCPCLRVAPKTRLPWRNAARVPYVDMTQAFLPGERYVNSSRTHGFCVGTVQIGATATPASFLTAGVILWCDSNF